MTTITEHGSSYTFMVTMATKMSRNLTRVQGPGDVNVTNQQNDKRWPSNWSTVVQNRLTQKHATIAHSYVITADADCIHNS